LVPKAAMLSVRTISRRCVSRSYPCGTR
jgi:hypothetical protein